MKKGINRLAAGLLGVLLGANMLFSTVSYAKEGMTEEVYSENVELESSDESVSDSSAEGADIPDDVKADEDRSADEASLEASTEASASEEMSQEDEALADASLEDESDEASSEDSEILEDELLEEAVADASDAASLLLSDDETKEEADSSLLAAESDPYSGTCGAKASWKYDQSSGVLTISGSGAMYDYELSNPRSDRVTTTAPWFQYAKEIKDVVISDDITYIGAAAFATLRTNKKNYSLPSKLTGIGTYAFYYFRMSASTTGATFTIPGTLTDIADNCFEQMYLPFGSIILKEGIKSVGNYSFQHAISDGIQLPDSLTTVGISAFDFAGSPQEYTIPKGIKKIGRKGFWHLQHVRVLTFAGDMPEMDEEAFGYNSVIAYYNPNNKGFSEAERNKASQYFGDVTWKPIGSTLVKKAGDNITWSFDEKTGTLRFDGSGAMYNYSSSNLPDWYHYATKVNYWYFDPKITEIGDYCFYHMGDFRAGLRGNNNNNPPVTLPKKLTRIGKYAFCDDVFYHVTMADEVGIIDDGAFYHASLSVTDTVVFPKKVKKIGAYAFYEARLSDTVIDLSSMEYIGEKGLSFRSDSSNITASFELPDSLKYIGDSAFKMITPTSTTLRLSPGMEYLGSYAFNTMTELAGEIEYPSSLTEIKEGAFYNTLVDCVKFSNTLKKVELNALNELKSLSKVTFTGAFPSFDTREFRSVENKLTIYYPFDDESWNEGIKSLQYDPDVVEFVPTGKSTTVSFVDFNGKVIETQTVAPSGKLTKPSVTTVNGKKIGGWYTSKTVQYEGTKWNFDSPVKCKITLYAGAEYTGYRAVFYPDNGQDPVVQNVKAGECAKEITPKREGYRFKGWYEKREDGSYYYDFKTPLENDITLVASWVLFRPVVTYLSEGYDYIPKRSTSYTTGAKFWDYQSWTADYEKEGYAKFVGWYLDEKLTKAVPKDYTLTTDLTVYGKWDVVTHKVTFVYGDGRENLVMDVPHTNDVKLPENPVRKGYSFRGWYLDQQGNTRASSTIYNVTEDKTIYALWEARNIYVKTVLVLDGQNASYNGYYINAGQTLADVIEQFNSNTSSNWFGDYEIEGWYYDEKCTSKIKMAEAVYEETTIYGKMQLKSYTVTIDPDNGEAPYTIKVQSGKRPDVQIPVRKGYEFVGWTDGEYIDDTIPSVYKESSYKALWKKGGYSQDLKITGVTSMSYTGMAVTLPDLKLTDGSTELISGKDYTVKYSNNVNVGVATLTITYKGIYAGKSVVNFNIVEADIGSMYSKGTITSSFETNYVAYNKKLQKVKPKITSVSGGKKVVLKENKDYKLEFVGTDKNASGYNPDAFKEPGRYTIKVTGMGSFKGGFNVYETITNDKLTSKLSVSGLKSSYVFTGADILPAFEVKAGKTVIGKHDGTSFTSDLLTCAISSNKLPGTAQITLTAKDGSVYAGSKTVTFTIKGKDIKKFAVSGIEDKIYSGKGITQSSLVVTDPDGNKTLSKDNYVVSYSKNINKGTAKVIIEGKNGYAGKITKTFKITAGSLYSITLSDEELCYTKKGSKPSTITVWGTTSRGQSILKDGTDYKLTIANNKKAGQEATITVTGIGNYQGKLTKNYKVVEGKITQCRRVVERPAYKNKVGNFACKVAVYDNDWTKLTLGTDYKVTYSQGDKVLNPKKDKLEKGDSFTCSIRGIGNYSLEKAYMLTLGDGSSKSGNNPPPELSTCKFSIRDYTYTGEEIKPSKTNIIVTDKKGNRVSTDSYQIVGYENNVNVGTAVIILKGNSGYTGQYRLKFKIIPRTVEEGTTSVQK